MKKVVVSLIIIGIMIILAIIGYYFIHGGVEARLNGLDKVTVTVNTEYHDEGFKLFKNNDVIDSSKYSFLQDDNIDVTKLGEYHVNYSIKYFWKNYVLSRTVLVIDDVVPVIKTNIKMVERDFCSKKDKEKLTFTAMDNYDGDLTDKIVSKEEEERIMLSVLDNSGNEGVLSVPIKYTQKPNPVFKLNGSSTLYITLNSKYNDSGVTNQDGCGNNIKEDIKTVGSVDTTKTGEYTLTYTNKAGKSLKRKVVVYDPKTNPEIKANGKVIYLTFDDGPGSYTQKVLNTLAKYNVKATFFVTHQFSSYVNLIQKEYDAGHAIGVHTYTHNWNVYKSVDAYVNDFNKMQNDVIKYTGSKTMIFRFPGGSSNTISRNYAKGVVAAIASKMTKDGYVYFDWDVDSGDAAGASRSKIYSNVVNGVKKCSKCVVLMHDIKSNTVNELDNILNTLVGQGYKFGTLSTSSPTVHQKIVN